MNTQTTPIALRRRACSSVARRVRFDLPDPEEEVQTASDNLKKEPQVSGITIHPSSIVHISTHHRRVRFDDPPKPVHLKKVDDVLARAIESKREGELVFKMVYDPDPIEDDDDDLDDGDDWTAYEIDRLDSGLSGLHRRLIRGWVGIFQGTFRKFAAFASCKDITV
ncbi:hypothetical protein CC1G_10387 [Coprinopsis cinerea okayama7|uniref:Uncharacterized protein n=1 Tax=Coprinopsis cinerea (strain Okayama-7 / 130 / ATCC MYA-4618 / FGSC 9003) TaxID=240176 RepID=A8PAK9_COPC7|nr:hypothetical protein CC1G_10387 [Coprinopsis cinerea okayama7\|eukprot:XP_001840003.1 hypothetical protein CC1G_10387 [Coprinopsis cinerea okayama7\